MGVWMAARGMVPDRVLVSSAVRAQETFGIWCEGAAWEGPSETDSDLYLASAGCICDRLTSLGEETQRVLIVGHNPGLSRVIRTLADRVQMMDTSALAHLSMGDGPWSEAMEFGGCQWVGCWAPRDLPDLS
jgi:phosphohistidine phosphatase